MFWDAGQKSGASQKLPGSGFQKVFKQLIALKLSLHGYIVIAGYMVDKPYVRYLIYNLGGDVLLRDYQERPKREIKSFEVKSVFLNGGEDQLVIATNQTNEQGFRFGKLQVMKLYGMEKIADLSNLVFCETVTQIQQYKQSPNMHHS